MVKGAPLGTEHQLTPAPNSHQLLPSAATLIRLIYQAILAQQLCSREIFFVPILVVPAEIISEASTATHATPTTIHQIETVLVVRFLHPIQGILP